MSNLVVPSALIASTLAALQEAGRAEHERVVLWLGRRGLDQTITVTESFVPAQMAEADYFHIPRSSIVAVFDRLRNGSMIAAQVHSHPGPAFHSTADDRWAIIRHLNALSLVLPNFALNTTVESFLADAAVFRLSDDNEWVELPVDVVPEQIVVGP